MLRPRAARADGSSSTPARTPSRAERGATLSEYALIVSLVITATAAVITMLQDESGSYLIDSGSAIGEPRGLAADYGLGNAATPPWLTQPPPPTTTTTTTTTTSSASSSSSSTTSTTAATTTSLPIGASCASEAGNISPGWITTPATLTVVNNATVAIDLYWLDGSGNRVFFTTVAAGDTHVEPTIRFHKWVLTPSGSTTCIMYITMWTTNEVATVS